MKKRAKKSRKSISHTHILSVIFGIVLSVAIFYFIYSLKNPVQIPSFSFTNDPQPNKLHYVFGDIYLSLLIKVRSLNTLGTVNGVIFHGVRDKKQIALTFDADMTQGMGEMLSTHKVESFYDRKLIQILRSTQTKATFFLTGMWIEQYPNESKDLGSDPLFELGSHSYAHKSFNGYCYGLGLLANNEKIQDIGYSQMILKKTTDINSKLFRFPGGCYGLDDVLLVEMAGEKVIQWDVVANDGFNNNTNLIVQNVINNVKNGSIIVMHMNGYPNDPKTAEAIPFIIYTLKNKGFEFVKVSDLL